MLDKKQLVATLMAAGMLAQTPGVFADVIPSNGKTTEITQNEVDTLPFLSLNSDLVGEKITAVNIVNNTLAATRTTDYVNEEYNVGYGIYKSDSPVFNTQTATLVETMFTTRDDLSQINSHMTIDSYPVAQYYYIVDNSTPNHVAMVRINGSDLLGNNSF